jgi:L-arabinose isomerase
MRDFAEVAGVELITIDAASNVESLRQTLRNNEVYYLLVPGLAQG